MKTCACLGLLWACYTVAGLALPASAAAQQTRQGQYEEIVQEAVAEHQRANWDEAYALFERAHALNPNARTLRGLGMSAYEGKRYLNCRAPEAQPPACGGNA